MKIKLLPQHIVEKIAAGEVVERPASVVKELMENALDALAQRVIVKVGLDQVAQPIEVIDDGEGMSQDEVLLAIQRHATSKISAETDLHAIKTLGFRGEALPSIAAVAQLYIETRQQDAEVGVRVAVESGTVTSIEASGVPKGTRVCVRELFSSTPARRKFLRSPATEWYHIQSVFERIALSRQDVHFQLWRGKKQWLNAPPTQDLRQRIGHIMGWELSEHAYPFEAEEGGFRMYGMITEPEYHGLTPRHMLFFVNRRPVKDLFLQRTLRGCYQGHIPKDRYPGVLLFLELPFDQVDVNVHPAKLEVRFAHPNRIASLVTTTITRLLKEAPWDRNAIRYIHEQRDLPRSASSGVLGNQERYPCLDAQQSSLLVEEGKERSPACYLDSQERHFTNDIKSVAELTGTKEEYAGEYSRGARDGYGRFADLRVLGQFHDEFIVCVSGEHLVLLDQHAAHERIVFEKLRQSFANAGIDQQALLVPSTVELSRRDAEVLEKRLAEVQTWGLEIEYYGGNSFAVKSVPSLLAGADPALLLKDIAEELCEAERSTCIEELRDRIFARMACHSVVRGKRRMAPEEINALLVEMDNVDITLRCPHGRPVLTAWSLAEIRKRFHRT